MRSHVAFLLHQFSIKPVRVTFSLHQTSTRSVHAYKIVIIPLILTAKCYGATEGPTEVPTESHTKKLQRINRGATEETNKHTATEATTGKDQARSSVLHLSLIWLLHTLVERGKA